MTKIDRNFSLPPFDYMGFIIPVFSRSMCVNICINSCPVHGYRTTVHLNSDTGYRLRVSLRISPNVFCFRSNFPKDFVLGLSVK